MTEQEMTGLLLKLADLGITGIKIHYDGSGDSGCVEEIVYTKDQLSNNEEEAFDQIDDLSIWEDPRLILLDTALEAELKDFADSTLLNNIEDWWNDDGGYGDILVLIPSGKYKILNNIRITEVEHYTHEGTLIHNTLK